MIGFESSDESCFDDRKLQRAGANLDTTALTPDRLDIISVNPFRGQRCSGQQQEFTHREEADNRCQNGISFVFVFSLFKEINRFKNEIMLSVT